MRDIFVFHACFIKHSSVFGQFQRGIDVLPFVFLRESVIGVFYWHDEFPADVGKYRILVDFTCLPLTD